MARAPLSLTWLAALCTALTLSACGGGGGDNGGSSPSFQNSPSPQVTEPNAPALTGNTATDGFNWLNFRRTQAGLHAVTRNSLIDSAAQNHSDYQKANNTITHEETAGLPGFTGVTVLDRLNATGYRFTQNGFAYGEVISAMTDTSGVNAAEDLITAIYHRFVIFEPRFLEAGAGAATVSGGYTYFTTDFTANGLSSGLGFGQFIVYPLAGQSNVQTNFFSDFESPDPVADRNEVGYPVSVHANIDAIVTVQSFTIRPRGGAPLPVKLLTHDVDVPTPSSAAAIIPLSPLTAGTTYDVQFLGAVAGLPASRSWSFTTR
jgi:uncharacterized protein YkwD